MTWPLFLLLVTTGTALLIGVSACHAIERERRKRHALQIDMLAHVERLYNQNADTMTLLADVVRQLKRIVQ